MIKRAAPPQPRPDTLPRGFVFHRMPDEVASAHLAHPLLRDFLVTDSGYFPRIHWHKIRREKPYHDNHFLWVAEGRGWMRLLPENKHPLLHLRAGDLVLCPEGFPHAYESDPDDPWSLQWFCFRGQAQAEWLRLLGASDRIAVRSAPAGLVLRLRRWFRAFHRLRSGGWERPACLAASLDAARLLADLAPLPLANEGHPAQPVSPVASPAARACALLQERPAEDWSVPALARACGLSASRLHAAFKAETGFTPAAYLTQVRIRRACRLLDLGDAKLAAVAQAVGYRDVFHFSRVFRQVMGMPPSTYRKRLS